MDASAIKGKNFKNNTITEYPFARLSRVRGTSATDRRNDPETFRGSFPVIHKTPKRRMVDARARIHIGARKYDILSPSLRNAVQSNRPDRNLAAKIRQRSCHRVNPNSNVTIVNVSPSLKATYYLSTALLAFAVVLSRGVSEPRIRSRMWRRHYLATNEKCEACINARCLSISDIRVQSLFSLIYYIIENTFFSLYILREKFLCIVANFPPIETGQDNERYPCRT